MQATTVVRTRIRVCVRIMYIDISTSYDYASARTSCFSTGLLRTAEQVYYCILVTILYVHYTYIVYSVYHRGVCVSVLLYFGVRTHTHTHTYIKV